MSSHVHRVLIVDDDRQLSELLCSILERRGYEAAAAGDGAIGMRYIDEHNVDVIITDIHMPERDGIEVIMYVRANSPDTKIICMSGGSSLVPITFLREAQFLGADLILHKPVSALVLLEHVRQLLEGEA